jgi:hypothetical protein
MKGLFRSRVGAVAAVAALINTSSPAAVETNLRGGSGRWTDAPSWSGGVPDKFEEASVGGSSLVAIPPGHFETAILRVGGKSGDRARVELDGGELLIRQDSLIVGEYTNSEGTFIVNDGAVHSVMDVFVGAATGSVGRKTKANLIIRGGSLLGLTITVGEGLGSESLFSVEGSRPSAVHALEFVLLLAGADPDGTPGRTTLAFTLDEHGVTPITIGSRWRGLEISHDRLSHCLLRVGLKAIPPREDVTLVSSQVATQGAFDGLPEGADVSAEFGGRAYRWTLTYQGGAGGHDLVLLNRSTYAAAAPVTHVRPLPEVPAPLWRNHPVYPLAVERGAPAFPGAEGYGADTPGGRGGRTLYIDNLNDAGPGSLRAAVLSAGPRILVFRTAGVIALKSSLVVTEPFLTIDGEGGPKPGILLRRHGIEVRTHDVVLRDFRIRIGDDDVHRNDRNVLYTAGDGEYALYFTEGSRRCIADHLSLSWSTNKILSTTKLSDLITVQWCILSESLNLEEHGYASITGGNRVSWHHNLFAHNFSRNVRFQGAVDADFRNNVIYDWGEKAAYGEFDRLNYVGNYLKPGPSTMQKPPLFHEGIEAVLPGSLFLSGNVMEGNPRATGDNWKGTGFYFSRTSVAASTPFPAPSVTTEPAAEAYNLVLRDAGATLPARDAVDARIVREVRTGTGHIVESVQEAGGWPMVGDNFSPATP